MQAGRILGKRGLSTPDNLRALVAQIDLYASGVLLVPQYVLFCCCSLTPTAPHEVDGALLLHRQCAVRHVFQQPAVAAHLVAAAAEELQHAVHRRAGAFLCGAACGRHRACVQPVRLDPQRQA